MLFRKQINHFAGLEFGVFKLKAGITEAHLITMSKQVETALLSKQEALLAHFILKGEEGLYADVVIATTQEKAEAICQLWAGHEAAQEYLTLIDSETVNMTFWTRIN